MHALRPPNRGILSPVPCWRSWVARAGLAAVGTVVLPLSLDDPGAIVTCGGRALVTADKGNGPQCVRSFEGVGAGPACPPADPAPMQRGGHEDGYRGHRGLHRYRASARKEHWATALSREGRKVFGRALPNDEERLRALYKKLADHGHLLVAVVQDMGITVGYLPGLNRPGFGGGSDDRKDHCHGTQGSIPMSCASELRGWRWRRWLTRRGPRARAAESPMNWVFTSRLCAPGSRRPRSMAV